MATIIGPVSKAAARTPYDGGMQTSTGPAAAPFGDLTPDTVLNALDSAGLVTSGSLLALNSYENRVFQAGIETPEGGTGFIVAKFYRPGRWSDAQILEEHAFVAELAAAEVPAVPPLVLLGRTLNTFAGYRARDLLSDQDARRHARRGYGFWKCRRSDTGLSGK